VRGFSRFDLRPYHFLIFSHLLIALAAVAQCALTYRVLGLPCRLPVLAINGCGTLLLYNAVLLLSMPKDPARSPYLRTRWVFGHLFVFALNTLLALSGLLWAVWRVHGETLLLLIALAACGLLYGLPIFTFRRRKVGLRQLPGTKLFHIALMWSLSTVGLPLIEARAAGMAIDIRYAAYWAMLQFLFMLVNTLPFDIRDMRRDALYGLKTIPLLLGERRAKRLCHSLLAAHALIVLCAPYSLSAIAGLLATDVAVGLTLGLLLFRRTGHEHYVYLLDFALIVQCVLTVP